MRKRVQITILMLLFSILGLCLSSYAATPEIAEPQASKYFASTEVTCIATGSGKVTVEVAINATHTMTQLGTKRIEIWEKQSDGGYHLVKTYTAGMLEYNTAFAYTSKTYQGIAGRKYYAIATLYAKNSSGSQTMYQVSSTVTAK